MADQVTLGATYPSGLIGQKGQRGKRAPAMASLMENDAPQSAMSESDVPSLVSNAGLKNFSNAASRFNPFMGGSAFNMPETVAHNPRWDAYLDTLSGTAKGSMRGHVDPMQGSLSGVELAPMPEPQDAWQARTKANIYGPAMSSLKRGK